MGGLIIAGERSGAGKTTVTLALLAALGRRSQRVQSFKVGPDYIDPMFHRYVTRRPAYNLDPVLTSEAYIPKSYAYYSRDAEYALVEGVMGLFDGASGAHDFASTAHIARLLDLPILLVIDCSRLSRSAAAIVHGYRTFDPRLQFAGVVLNRVGSDRHLDLLKAALTPLNLPILGVLRRQESITIPDRHLGLVPTAELPELRQITDQLADLGEQCFDWQQLEPLLKLEHPPHTPIEPPYASSLLSPSTHPPIYPSTHPPIHQPRIAIAHDSAFSFYYPDNLEILAALGAELVYWSPLKDKSLPENIQGLYFGGGFPEVFAEALSANKTVLQQVKQAVQANIPTYAECGGLMYLCQSIADFAGNVWPMVGVLPTAIEMGQRLTLGYRQVEALQASSLLPKNIQAQGHEFHRSRQTTLTAVPLYRLCPYDGSRSPTEEGWHIHRVHASYVHMHWGGSFAIAHEFVKQCQSRMIEELPGSKGTQGLEQHSDP
ncbi:cobyrinate a,c-diamide synthase [Pseudanabaena sp. FACHB-2040]|uniref:cobyrinate a,c-diamide synthase n=1 Tax=Pseudanabaena sp. FACHB-2040 TaxID=2692859 RepID=UPI001686DD21|nr:cobyrinate a,c-diamide synthase [Pseudanabaena sp. FACHB-2040]MBD2256342.1 cobyrinate a,c-diamide synthase [Pseudanabaena sp. FACHB-2040]